MSIRYGCLWTLSEPLDPWLEGVITSALAELQTEAEENACDNLQLSHRVEREMTTSYHVDERGSLVIDVLVPFGLDPMVDRMLQPLDPNGQPIPVEEEETSDAS